jgi:hypothetical protein
METITTHSRPPFSLKVIVNCGPSRHYIAKCLESLRAQTLADWEAYVTVDPFGDGTFNRAVEAAGGDPRISITHNNTRMYAMANLVSAIERSRAEPEDVIVVLDGDDWFYRDDALQIIAEAYTKNDCWMTYGSWESNVEHIIGGLPAYSQETINFREAEWLATAVRTWKKWLWNLIDDKDLRDEKGNYLAVAEDVAVMFPMLEMSGTQRARHIPQILMLYNRANPACVGNVRRPELERIADYIRRKPRYRQLISKPVDNAVV